VRNLVRFERKMTSFFIYQQENSSGIIKITVDIFALYRSRQNDMPISFPWFPVKLLDNYTSVFVDLDPFP